MRRVKVLVLLAATVLFTPFGAGQETGDPPLGMLDDREQRIRDRYEQALERNPFQDQAFDRVYESYLAVEGIDAWADQLVERANATDDSAIALTLLGRIRERQFKTEEAVSYLEQARDTGQAGVGLDMLLGTLYYQAGSDEQSIDLLSKSLESLTDAEERGRVCRMLGALNMRRGDRDAAITAWKRLTELNSNDLFMQVELAEIYEDNRLWDDAVGTYRHIIELAADDPYRRCRSLRSIGRCYLELEDYPEAIATFEQAMELAAPGNWLFEDLKQRLVSVYQDLGDLQGLADYLLARVTVSPADIEIRDLLAATYARMGRPEEAENEYRAILERYPGRAGTYEHLISLYVRSENHPQIIEAYEELIKLYPTEPDYLRRLGEVYLQDNAPDLAKSTWERWIAEDSEPKHLAEVAGWYEVYEFPEDAMRLYERALEGQADKEWTIRLAALQLDAGDEQAALATWRSSLTDASTAAEYSELAALLDGNGFHKEAEPLLLTALEKEPDNAEIWHALAKNLMRQERFEEALPHYEQLAALMDNDYFMERDELGLLDAYAKLEILAEKQEEWEKEAAANPDSAPVLIRLARLYDRSGDRENAISLYRRCTELEPENPEYLRILARTYRKMKHFDETIALFVRLLEIDKNRTTAYNRELLDIYLTVDLREEAIETARKIVEKTPGDAEARLDLAQVYQTYLMPDDALQEYRHALRLEPDEPRYHEVYGQALSAEQRWGEAQEAFRKMLQSAQEEDTRRSAITSLAGIYLQQDQIEDLIGEFQRRIRNTPKKFAAYEELASVYREAGETVRGVEALEEGLMAVDDKTQALQALIRTTYEAEQFEKVVTYYEELIARSGTPSSREYERLGRVYVQLGDIEKARETWTKMTESDPDNPRVHSRLAKALQEQGFTEEAAVARERALELNPNDFRLRFEHAQQLAGIDQMDRALEQLYELLELGERKAQDEEKSPEKKVNRRHRGSRYGNQAYMYSQHYRPSNYRYFGGTNSAQFQQFRRSVIGAIASMAENSVGVDTVVEDFQARVDASPNDFGAKQDLLVVLQTANRAEPALALAEEIVALRPNDVDVLEQMSLVYSWQQKTDKSIELLERLAELQPTQRKQHFAALVSLHQRAGNEEAVDELATRILDEYGDDYMAISQLMNAYQYANRYEKIAELEPYVEKMDPKYQSAYRLQVARALAQGDDKARARELYHAAIFDSDPASARTTYRSTRPKVYAPTLSMQNNVYYGRNPIYNLSNSGVIGQVDYTRSNAIEALYKLMENDESRKSLREELYEAAARYQSASTKKERAEAWGIGKLLAVHYITDKEFDLTLELLEDFGDWGLDSMEWFNLTAFAHEQREHFDEMIAVYEAYEKRYPQRSLEILQAKTNVAFASNDFDTAEANIEQYFNRAVPPKKIIEALQRLYDSEEHDRARRLLEKHLQGMNRSSEALLLLAKLHANENDYDRALEIVREAWSRKAHGPRSSGQYYGGYYNSNRRTSPSELLRTLHQYAKEAGKTDELIEEFKDRLAKQPGSVQRYEDLANLYNSQNQSGNAITVWKQLLERRPTLTSAQTSLAELFVNTGKPNQAMEIYESVMARSPSAYRRIRWRVRDLYQRTGKGEKLAEAEESMMKQATNPNQMRDLAYDFLNRGEHEKAAELFAKIIKMDPSQFHMNNQLASSYVALGRIDDAIETYTKYLESPMQRSRGYIDMNAMTSIVRLYAGSGRLDELEEKNAARLEKDAKDNLALAIQAQIAKRQHRFEDAYELLVGLAEVPNVGRSAVNDILEIAEFTGREEETLALLEDRKLTENYWDMSRLARFYLAHGQREKAAEAWADMPKRYGGSHGYQQAFDSMIRHGLWPEAGTFFENNRRAIMTDLNLMNQIGSKVIDGYMTRRGFDSVAEDLVEGGVKGVALLLIEGVASGDRQDIARAREIIEPLVEREPENKALLGVYAELLKRGGYWSEALPLYETLVRTANRSGKYTQPYAECLTNLGRERQAVNVLNAWVKKKPDGSRYRTMMNVLKQRGRIRDALELEEAAVAAVDASDRDQIEATFAALRTEQGAINAERQVIQKAFETQADAQTFQRYFSHLYQRGWNNDAHALIEANKDAGYIDHGRTNAQSIIDVCLLADDLGIATDLSWQYLRYSDQRNRTYYSDRVAGAYLKYGRGAVLLDAFEEKATEEETPTGGVQEMIANIAAATGDHERALTIYESLLDQNPYKRETRTAKALQLRSLRRFEEEAEFWSSGIGSMTLRDEANDTIAQAKAWFEAGDDTKGDATLAELRSWAKDSKTSTDIGALYLSLDRYEDARTILESGVGLHNRSLNPGQDLAKIYAIAGETDRAMELWREFRFDSAYRGFPDWVMARRLYVTAAPIFEQMIDDRPLQVTLYVKLAEALQHLGQPDAYRARIADGWNRMSEDRRADLVTGYAAFLVANDLVEGLLEAEAFKDDPVLARALAQAFWALAKSDKKTANTLEPAFTDFPATDAETMLVIGQAMASLEERVKATSLFERVASDATANESVRVKAILAMEGVAEYDAAFAPLSTIAELNPGVLVRDKAIMAILGNASDTARAKELLAKVSVLCPFDEQVSYWNTLYAYYSGEKDEALNRFAEFATVPNLTHGQLVTAAGLLEDEAREDDALAIWSRITDGGYGRNERERALFNVIRIQLRQEKFADAVGRYADFLPLLSKSSMQAAAAIADHVSENNLSDAKRVILALIEEDPSAERCSDLATLYAQLSERAEVPVTAAAFLEAAGAPKQEVAEASQWDVLIEDWQFIAPLVRFVTTSTVTELPPAILGWAAGEDSSESYTVRQLSDTDVLGIVDVEGSAPSFQLSHGTKMGYAKTTINAETGGVAGFTLGSAGPIAVWVNGERVHDSSGMSPVHVGQERFFAQLNPGTNTILVELAATDGAWRFCLGASGWVPPQKSRVSN